MAAVATVVSKEHERGARRGLGHSFGSVAGSRSRGGHALLSAALARTVAMVSRGPVVTV